MQVRGRAWVLGLVCAMALAGCSDDDEHGLAGPPRDAGSGGTGRDAAVVVDTGLPCDVATVLATHCTVCHGTRPIGAAPMSLVTFEDLTAASASMPGVTNAQLSVMRMQDTVSPMPPGAAPSVPAADIATLQAWIDAGMQRGSCTNPTDPYGTPVMCTSGQHWTLGDEGSELMHPGRACISCHDNPPGGEAPDLPPLVAGTVYPSAHEPDDCYGARGDGGGLITVEVIGNDGASQTLFVNESGNFMGFDPVVLPVTAIVHYQGRTRSMTTEAPSADCNSCHTEGGTSDAPGRIMLP